MDIEPRAKLTVIVPLHNNEFTIGRCLDSVVNQSEKNIHVIVVDDYSVDSGIEVVQKYINAGYSIEIMRHNARRGPGAARNTGLTRVSSEYVAFLDGDDWIDLSAYQTMMADMERSHSDIGVCGIKTEGDLPEQSSVRYAYTHPNTISSKLALKMLTREYQTDYSFSAILGNKVFRRTEAWQKCKFPEVYCYEDNVFMFESIMHSQGVAVISNAFHHYYQRSDSIVHSFSEEHVRSLTSAFIYLKEILIKRSQFETYKRDFYFLLKKCISFLLYSLDDQKLPEREKREYICHMCELLHQNFPMREIVNYIGTDAIIRLFPYKGGH